jgi:hypothetical protein
MNILDIDHGKKDQEKNGRGKDVHPDRVQVTGPPPLHVLPGQKAGFGKKVFNGHKKLPVKMGDIREKMGYQVPNGLFWLDIFLSAGRAIPARCFGSAVKAYLFRSYLAV